MGIQNYRHYGTGNPNGLVAFQDTNQAGKVKSFSGRYLSWLNGRLDTQRFLNPANDSSVTCGTWKKIGRFVARFFVGLGSIFVGFVGFWYHLGATIKSKVWDKDGHALEHLCSMFVDLIRMSGLGAIGYAISPDSYFATGEGRVDPSVPTPTTEDIVPVPKNRHALINELSLGIAPLIAKKGYVKDKLDLAHTWIYGGIDNPNTQIAKTQGRARIKCLSGRVLSWLNGNKYLCRIFNPENKYGNIAMAFPRLIIGGALSSIAGAIGFVYHLIHSLCSYIAGSKENGKAHLKSALVDLLRGTGIGGVGYMLKPDAYFAQHEGRVDSITGDMKPKRTRSREFHLLEYELFFIPLIVHLALAHVSKDGGKVKSLSGRALSAMSTKWFFNPENVVGNILMGVPRLIVGSVVSFVGAFFGFFYHSLQVIHHFLADKENEMAWKHLKSAAADLFRLATIGIGAGLTFALAPNRYVPKGAYKDGRTIDPDEPGYECGKVVNYDNAMHPIHFEFPLLFYGLGKVAFAKKEQSYKGSPPSSPTLYDYGTYDHLSYGTFIQHLTAWDYLQHADY